ncbi:hypothetical protein Pla100_19350 [Neorhodopirellula pilleata]|uniref:Uncharacterized protein n=1 Tax=Neorhodopirellula pilleata TaxID=2714738 RepID=A0A5C6AGN7_9BACT|nr:hypothetical protein Pla100_19350 [Neorhodopirellula pilleata]
MRTVNELLAEALRCSDVYPNVVRDPVIASRGLMQFDKHLQSKVAWPLLQNVISICTTCKP